MFEGMFDDWRTDERYLERRKKKEFQYGEEDLTSKEGLKRRKVNQILCLQQRRRKYTIEIRRQSCKVYNWNFDV